MRHKFKNGKGQLDRRAGIKPSLLIGLKHSKEKKSVGFSLPLDKMCTS